MRTVEGRAPSRLRSPAGIASRVQQLGHPSRTHSEGRAGELIGRSVSLHVVPNVTSRDAGAATARHREDARFVCVAEPVAFRLARVAARGHQALARPAGCHRRAVTPIDACALAAVRARVEVTRTGRECCRGRRSANRASGEPLLPAKPQYSPATLMAAASRGNAGVNRARTMGATLTAKGDRSRRLDGERHERQHEQRTRQRG